MDLNTHNAFYCTLLFSSNPSFLLLLPICLHSLTSIGAKGTLLVSKVAVIKAVATPLLKQITSRTADIARFSAQVKCACHSVHSSFVIPRQCVCVFVCGMQHFQK